MRFSSSVVLSLVIGFGCSTAPATPGADGGSSGGSGGGSAATGGGSSAGSAGHSRASGGSSGGGATTRGSGGMGTASGSSGRDGSSGGSGTTGGGSTTGGAGTSGGGSTSGGGACALPDNYPCGPTDSGLCCGGSCIDPLSDPQNCAACGNACPVCLAGACSVTDCSGATWGANCQMAGPDGGLGFCCASGCTAPGDPLNCGGCGVVCAQGAACVAGQCSASCTAGSCPAGFACSLPTNSTVSVCLASSCAGALDGQPCAVSATTAGTCCDQVCVDTSSDSNNCSWCGAACSAGAVCVGGACEAVVASCGTASMGSRCQQGDGGLGICCGICEPWSYQSYQSDPENCGGCGVACPAGVTCVNGQCASFCGAAAACPAGRACDVYGSCLLDPQSCGAANQMEPCVLSPAVDGDCCGAACVDLLQDSANCGVCGNACAAGTFCTEGQCLPTPTCGAANSGVSCPLSSNQVGKCCSGSCTDVRSDPGNCTGCGVACPTGEICNPGINPPCALPDGGMPGCIGAAGACPAGTTCVGWDTCLPSSCPAGASGGLCAFGAGGDQGLCCGGACVDPNQDPQNCGGCAVACASGVCPRSGIGFLATCLPPAASTGSCQVPCQSPMVCLGNQCVSSACDGPSGGLCAAANGNPGICCMQGFGASCADVANDPLNCGGCGIACPAGQSCALGVCSGAVAPCLAGRFDAYCDLDAGTALLCCPGGGCTDVEADPQNCGSCDQPCQPGLACVAGNCLALACSAATAGQSCAGPDGGTGLCCGTSCKATASDPQNCGGCGTTCAGGESCNWGLCGFDQCTPSLQGDPCHFDAGSYVTAGLCCGSSCVDSSSDPTNCGGCNIPCGPDAGCFSGKCA